jgi:hypothetical protein
MTEERRGEPEPAFAYESYKPLKTLEQIEEFVKTSGIAGRADLKGTTLSALNVALPAMQAVVERFGLKPLAGFGNVTRFYSRVRGPKGALAAIYSTITDAATGNKGLFHIPATGFGQGAEKISVIARRNAATYKSRRDAALNPPETSIQFQGQPVRGPNIDPEVRVRVAQMDQGGGATYNWTVDSTSESNEFATRATVFHEYGHVIHLTDARIGAEINEFLRTSTPLRTGWQYLLSVYGGTNDKEYIAETFAIYMGMPESEHFRIHPELLKIYRRLDRKVTR